jgi:hypothetical protein
MNEYRRERLARLSIAASIDKKSRRGTVRRGRFLKIRELLLRIQSERDTIFSTNLNVIGIAQP